MDEQPQNTTSIALMQLLPGCAAGGQGTDMNTELVLVTRLLEHAQNPEDVFGKLEGNQAEALRRAYRSLSKVVHPDRYRALQDQATAEQAFQTLQKWLQTAEDKVACGMYGHAAESSSSNGPVLVRNRKNTYLVHATPFVQGDLGNIYHCTHTSAGGTETAAVFKVARNPHDNDLVANEASVLHCLASSRGYKQYHAYVPRIMDSFQYQDPSSSSDLHRVNVLTFETGQYFSLREVRACHTQGINPKDMAWIWRRLLVALCFAHSCGIIHGAVLPTHVLIQPEQHGLVLIDWSYAVSDPAVGDHIPAIATEYQSWYPPEIISKGRPLPCTDLYMGALCMIYVLGGDPITRVMPGSVPKRIRSFFNGVALKRPTERPQSALVLLDEFTDLIEQLWGPRTFREFSMPK
jgi:serine/threonine protein kinase